MIWSNVLWYVACSAGAVSGSGLTNTTDTRQTHTAPPETTNTVRCAAVRGRVAYPNRPHDVAYSYWLVSYLCDVDLRLSS